jgi:hypothetical protein
MATLRAFQRNIRDNDLRVTHVLPAAASTTVVTSAIDLGALTSGASSRPSGLELVLKVPLLNTTQLPDTRTLTLTIEASDDSAFGSGVDVLVTKVITGAGGVGAAADELRGAINSFTKRYVRGKAVTGASTGDQSAVVAEFCVVA